LLHVLVIVIMCEVLQHRHQHCCWRFKCCGLWCYIYRVKQTNAMKV
jgi:hypothetical protein